MERPEPDNLTGSLNQFGNEILPGVRPPAPQPAAPAAMVAADEAESADKKAGPTLDENGATVIDRIRADHPDTTKAVSDYQLARDLYDSGAMHKDGESYARFAKRIGVQQSGLETFANEGLSTAALHLNE